jgi:hypothetical protein
MATNLRCIGANFPLTQAGPVMLVQSQLDTSAFSFMLYALRLMCLYSVNWKLTNTPKGLGFR